MLFTLKGFIMKTFFFLFMACALRCMVFAQTNVDNLVTSLDSLGTLSFNNWKVSANLKIPITGDPSKQEFNDSQWANYK
jgi:hypothetical protein